MACGQSGHADSVHVVFDRLAGAFLGGLEQRAHVDVETEVGEGRGHHLGAAVVTVLAQLADHHARAAALCFGKCVDLALQGIPAFGRRVEDRAARGRGGGIDQRGRNRAAIEGGVVAAVELAVIGDDHADQARVMSPKDAIQSGADFVVIGRSITSLWDGSDIGMRNKIEQIISSLQ